MLCVAVTLLTANLAASPVHAQEATAVAAPQVTLDPSIVDQAVGSLINAVQASKAGSAAYVPLHSII